MPSPLEVCREKLYFPSKRVAKRAARQLRHGGRTLNRPYRCPFCGSWHLSTCSAEDRARYRAMARTDAWEVVA